MARRAKRTEPTPAEGLAPSVPDEPSLPAVGRAGAVESTPSTAPAAVAPDVEPAPVGPEGVAPVVVAEPAPTPAPPTTCRHAVMRSGWDSKGRGKKPVKICDACGLMVPRDEGNRPTVPWG